MTAARRFGAHVILSGANYDEAAGLAAALGAERGLVYLHPFEDPLVIAGQGTVGLEILEDAPDLDAIIVPVGGGVDRGPRLRGQREQPQAAGARCRSAALPEHEARARKHPTAFATRRQDESPDGIAVRRVGELTRELTRKYVDEIALVDEAEIAQAVLLLLEREKTVVEGAGAVGVAALLQRRFANLEGKRVAVVLSGGNIDMNLISRIIEHGLVQTGA